MKIRLDFADALRGFAILGVILFHTYLGVRFQYLPPWFQHSMEQGARGVQLFFIVSAFTLFYALSYAHKNENNWYNFFIRRFFRIVPLFYLAILSYTLLSFALNEGISYKNILAHLTLLFGFNPLWINSLVPGGWTIATELLFYVTIPIIFIKIKNLKYALLLTVVALVFSIGLHIYLYSLPLVISSTENAYFLFFWLPFQFPIFCMGVVLFFILQKIIFEKENLLLGRQKITGDIISLCCIISACLMLILLILNAEYFRNPTIYIYGVAFSIFAVGLAINPILLFVNRFTVYLGKISYSCYLIHSGVIIIFNLLFQQIIYNFTSLMASPLKSIGVFVIIFLAILGLTILFSSFTYTYVEQKGIAFGKSLIIHINEVEPFNSNKTKSFGENFVIIAKSIAFLLHCRFRTLLKKPHDLP